MRGHGEKLSRKQELVIASLLTAPTTAEAARMGGVSEATLWRWMQVPSFRKAYEAARSRVVEVAVVHLQQAAIDAVAALKRNLTCGIPAVEIQAARVLLDQMLKSIEVVDLANRVQAMEAASGPSEERNFVLRLMEPGEGEAP